MKKEWKKPQLVVVVRGRAEENVLIACKVTDHSGAYDYDSECGGDINGRCNACEAMVGS